MSYDDDQPCESLDQLYARLCINRKEDLQDSVVQKLQSFSCQSDGVIDFSNSTLTASTCSVLADIFKNDVAVVKLILADCMLGEKSLKLLLIGLTNNTCLRHLDLRGNNFRQSACEAIGCFLKSNQFLTHLYLEWNCLGSYNSSFDCFCDGLATNTSLQYLDLRNNQIDHNGAKSLAECLRFNDALKSLDLRWNSVGLSGGRAICEALKSNTRLEQLEICGNNIPVDVCDNMETSLLHNRNTQDSTRCGNVKLSALHKEIELLKKGKKQRTDCLIEENEKSKWKLHQAKACATSQMSHLQQTLEDRKCAMNALRAKLDMAEANRCLIEKKLEEKEMLVELTTKDLERMSKKHECELLNERKCNEDSTSKMQEQLEEAQMKVRELDGKLCDSQRRLKCQSEELCLVKKQLVTTEEDCRAQLRSMEERSTCERERFCTEMTERDKRRDEELSKMRKELEMARDGAECRAKQALKSRDDIEQELVKAKKKIACNQHQYDEEIRALKKQLRDESEVHGCKLEERLRTVQTEKTALQKSLTELKAELLGERAAKEANEVETNTLKSSLQNIRSQASLRDAEHEQQLQNVRNEMRKREIQTQDELNRVSEYKSRISELQADRDRVAVEHRAQIAERDQQLDELRSCLRKYEDEMERNRGEESRRLDVLHNALLTYMQGSVHNSPKALLTSTTPHNRHRPPQPQ